MLIGTDTGTWVLAVATGALAIFTGVMALSSRDATRAAARTADAAERDIKQGATLVEIGQRQVDVGQEQVATALQQAGLAQSALDAERQPLLIPTTALETTFPEVSRSFRCHGLVNNPVQDFPVGKCWVDAGTAWVVIKVRNSGRGAALIGTELEDVVLDMGTGGTVYGEVSAMAVAPEDRAYMMFAGQPNSPALNARFHQWVEVGNAFSVRVGYFDITKRRRFVSSIHFGRDGSEATVTDFEFSEKDG